MKFQVIRTDKFDEQLRDIIFYIADSSQDIEAALKQLEYIEEGVKKLEDYPNSGSIPHYASLKRRGYRVLIVKQYLIFHKVNFETDTVCLYVILNSCREYLNLIE